MKDFKIAFLPRRSRIRLYKIAKALRYLGNVHLILVCEESFYDDDLFRGLFDEVHFFTRKSFLFNFPKAEKFYRRINERYLFGHEKLKKILNQVNPDLVHCFAEPYNHIAFVLKETKYKVVMTDGADFTAITVGFENIPSRIWIQEKYCFEHVSGVLHKGPAHEIDLYRKNGCKINCPEITWFDHCDDDLIISKEIKTLKPDHELHLVYAGNISTNPKQKYIYYIDFAKEMARQKIHFHIYSNPYQFNVAFEYRKLSNESEYFHFHAPLSYKDLVREISQYDWGLWWHNPAGGDRDSNEKNIVALGNKLFTYLESGLPVVVGRHLEYGKDLTERYGIGIAIDEEDIPLLRHKLTKNYSGFMKNVSNTADLLRLSRNANTVLDFYKNVLEVISNED